MKWADAKKELLKNPGIKFFYYGGGLGVSASTVTLNSHITIKQYYRVGVSTR